MTLAEPTSFARTLAGAPARDPLAGARIAFFAGGDTLGSRERTLLAAADELLRRDAEVDLLVPGSGDAWREETSPGVGITCLGERRRALAHLAGSNKRRIVLGVPALARHLRTTRPDVIVGWSIPPNLAALAARTLAGVPTRVVVRQSNVVHVPGDPRWADVVPRPRDRWIPRFYPSAAALIAVSAGVAENVRALDAIPAERIHVVPNGVPTRCAVEKGRSTPGHPWLVSRERPVILAVGRLVRKKDYPTLLRAFATVRGVHEARLVILGEGPERAPLQSLARGLGIAGAVAMPGYDPNPFASMTRASVLVLSSLSEGMPSVLVEALACGLPVVSTDCPSGPSEILEGGRHGGLVPVGDAGALAGAILDALLHPRDPERLRARAAELSTAAAAVRVVEVVRSVVAGAAEEPA